MAVTLAYYAFVPVIRIGNGLGTNPNRIGAENEFIYEPSFEANLQGLCQVDLILVGAQENKFCAYQDRDAPIHMQLMGELCTAEVPSHHR